MPKMDETELRSLLDAERTDALAAYTAAELSEDRARAQDYYLGNMAEDMPAGDGRSSAVSSDVADTVEGLLPSLIDIFYGSDDVVRFDPVSKEDIEAAQQETDYVNHVFRQKNDGFMVMYSFIKDALLSKVGIVKVWWDEQEQEQDETYYNQTPDQFAMIAQAVLASDGEIEIIEHSENQTPNGPMHDVKLKTTKKLAQAKVLGVPPEEFGIEKGARDIRTCNYCFHDVVTKTEAQLIAEGYDEDEVKKLGDYVATTNIETLERDSVGENFLVGSASGNSAARLVRITEHYIRMDYEGTGRPRLYQVVTGGEQGQILHKNDELACYPIDVMPFAAMTPVPITHRFFGRSVADLVLDIQRIKTALLRAGLDNMYFHVAPRPVVSEQGAGPNTIDDLLVVRQGAPIRVKGDAASAISWQVVPDISGSIGPLMEYIDTVREMRTGVTRQSQGVDANALQNQSATAVAQAFSMSQQKMKLIAKIFAETGVRDMFSLLHYTIRSHGQQAQTVSLRNQWVQVDPRQWKARTDMTINVGLGTGGKAERFAHLMAIVNLQKEAVQAGKTNLVDDAKLYNSAAQLCRLLDYKNPDEFFNDVTKKDPQTGQPMYPAPPPAVDPKLQVEQMRQQGKQAELQQKGQQDMASAALDAHHQQVKTQGESEIAALKAHLDAQLAILTAKLKAVELHQGMQHDTQRHHMDMAESVVGMVHDHQMHNQKLETMRSQPKADA